MRRVISLVLLLITAVGVRAEPVARHHMIAAANPLAAQAGLEMLRKGGSAVDAAIATQMVLNLVEPESSGLGGGAYMMVWDPKTKKLASFDGREMAPASATPAMFLDAMGNPRPHGDAIPGGLSVGVPGVLAMLELAHKKYGKLPWADLFAPAIRLAEAGFPVTKKTIALLQAMPKAAAMPDIKRYFSRPDGTLMQAGDILKNPELAATFRAIAKGGARAFYNGPIAQAIADKVQHAPVNPGGMTVADIAHYHAVERQPVCLIYRADKVCSMPPSSSGGIAVLQILGLLERFKPADLKPNTLSEVHLFSEATKLAFADRNTYVGDPAFVPVPIKGLLDRGYLHRRALLINPDRDTGPAEAGTPPFLPKAFAPQKDHEHAGTSHMSIVDDAGRVVAMTTTVESGFGSKMMTHGFILNNQLTDFSFVPVRDGKPVANAPGPGKRPMSSMAPTIVFDRNGHFLIAAGSPGGPAIICYVAQALLAMLDGGLDPTQAVALPHTIATNGPLLIENAPALTALTPALTQMGYDVRVARGENSGLHIIERTKDGYIGAADPRRLGVSIGD